MPLTHANRPSARLRLLGALSVVCVLAAACSPLPAPTPTAPGTVTITIRVDGQTTSYTFDAGLTVREAIAHAGITLGELDRLTPPPFNLIEAGTEIVITRVTEHFETEQAVLPYTSQTLRNESLPEGERRLLQVGANGLEEITYRTVFEDGVQVSRSIVKRVTVLAPVPEILMIGSQGSFTLVPISGTLAYISGQNAWIMRGNSGQRLLLTTTGDLDGRVFELSPDGQWLLYTRAVTREDAQIFNTLWAIPTNVVTRTVTVTRTPTVTTSNPVAISLPVSNVLYAEWSPVAPQTIAYSTAEKITRAPGWQANNDLRLLAWQQRPNNRLVLTHTLLLDSSSGGPYGWWGTGFAFAPGGEALAYARTDSVGLINFEITRSVTATVALSELAQWTPFNTHSDWAWYPALRWSPGGEFLYTITHGQPIGLEAPEDSPAFDLATVSVESGQQFKLIPRAGMFANPVPSPTTTLPSGEVAFRVAFMQAVDPNNSPFSTYRLGLMDRDGSNVRFIFPPPDQPGLKANEAFAWAPDGKLLAVIYEGNLWLVDPDSDLTQQITGDGLSAQPRWGP